MGELRLYLDEDASSVRLIDALRSRGLDVASAIEVGLREASDEQQLIFASEQNRAIYTFNAKHFCKLHREFTNEGRQHAGIIIGRQIGFSVGDQLRKLLRLAHEVDGRSMFNRLEFLSSWG